MIIFYSAVDGMGQEAIDDLLAKCPQVDILLTYWNIVPNVRQRWVFEKWTKRHDYFLQRHGTSLLNQDVEESTL